MELYIAPNGDDKARGTLDTPLKTLSAAVRRMAAADYLRGHPVPLGL